jgi:hypothetical protein
MIFSEPPWLPSGSSPLGSSPGLSPPGDLPPPWLLAIPLFFRKVSDLTFGPIRSLHRSELFVSRPRENHHHLHEEKASDE